MSPTPKTVRWVDDSTIRGQGAIKLVTDRGATIAWVRAPEPGADRRWLYAKGRGGGKARDRNTAIIVCEAWAVQRGYTVEEQS